MHKFIVRPLIGLIALIYLQQNSWDKAHMKTKTLEFILLSVVFLSLSLFENRFRLYQKENKMIFLF